MNQDNQEKTLNLYPIDYPFETLHSRITAKSPKLILNPDFQRKYKWDKDGWERSSKFIESCLMRIPLPSCYFAEFEDGKHMVIDGVQRLTTIVRFFNDEFALEGLSSFEELEGKKFSEIGQYKSELESTTIRCIILRKENPKYLIREIFSRLNQGAVELSDQEIRHAIYPGEFDNLLSELANLETVKKFGLGKDGKKVKDSLEAEELVLRYFALKGTLDNYQDRLSKYLDEYTVSKQSITLEEIEILRNEFNSTIDKCVAIFERDVFIDTTKQKRRQAIVYYDLLMYSFSDIDKEILMKNKDSIQNKFKELCKLDDFQRTLSSGLQNKSSILRRRKLWGDLLEAAINE
ncbi:MAG: DUF262 domain-containing protein [Nostoc sp. ZfuVER08]|uniref:DUF262 domain-containing protein n=1 Tax=Nostoc punctiforme FACHB-252 TaxID=1357509 RepID=A0ABR8HGQ9_NOSPU|nr:DUF262 domain-containing protein [Nostoc punctiforme]MBD2614365.1 DUF262 domain-containing protein [Nostoc punctiforme FACHB-252]MDZ8012996.1 DUF262 domain-containing protein [Nostoc sp. ZfuVER08]